MSEGVEVYQVVDNHLASSAEWRLASASPSFLRPLLGRAYRRRRVLARGVNWERVLFIEVEGEVAGYLQFYLRGDGPHRLSFSDLRAEFGGCSAAWRYPIYQLLQRRFQRFDAYLYRIIIHEPFRGQGLGYQLLKEWLELLEEEGVSQAELEVWGNNPRAVSFYESLGFDVVKRRVFPLRVSGLRDTQLLHMVRRW